VTILARGDALFECHFHSATKIYWRKNSKILSETHRRFLINHAYANNASYLRVTDASQLSNHHNKYNFLNITCIAENSHGRVESTAHLLIISENKKPLHFPEVRVSSARSVEPEAPFRIECNVSNVLYPSQVLWYENNRPVVFDGQKYLSNFSIISSGNFLCETFYIYLIINLRFYMVKNGLSSKLAHKSIFPRAIE
jgi:hypothetical protein